MRKFVIMTLAAAALALATPFTASASALPQEAAAKAATEQPAAGMVSACRCYRTVRYRYVRYRYVRYRYVRYTHRHYVPGYRYTVRWYVYRV